MNSNLNHMCIDHELSPWLRWMQLQVEQGRRPLMDPPFPMTTEMGATAWQQRWREIAVKTARVLSLCPPMTLPTGTSYSTERQQRQWQSHRDFIEALPEGVLWETGCNRLWRHMKTLYRNGSNINCIHSMTRHGIWECLNCPCMKPSPAEHMVCWISMQCVYVTASACQLNSCIVATVWDPCIAWSMIVCVVRVILVWRGCAMLSHIPMAVLCMQLLHVLHVHSLRLTPQYPL